MKLDLSLYIQFAASITFYLACFIGSLFLVSSSKNWKTITAFSGSVIILTAGLFYVYSHYMLARLFENNRDFSDYEGFSYSVEKYDTYIQNSFYPYIIGTLIFSIGIIAYAHSFKKQRADELELEKRNQDLQKKLQELEAK